MSPSMRIPFSRMLRIAGSWLAGGFALAVLLAAAAPIAIGERSYVVESGSMTPTIETGDVVILQPIAPGRARTGEIVGFRDPEGRGLLITHRVMAVAHTGRRFQFATQGDTNTTQEHWSVPESGQIGLVMYRIPKLGFAVAWIKSPGGRVALLIVPGLLLAVSLLGRIWRPSRTRDARGASTAS